MRAAEYGLRILAPTDRQAVCAASAVTDPATADVVVGDMSAARILQPYSAGSLARAHSRARPAEAALHAAAAHERAVCSAGLHLR